MESNAGSSSSSSSLKPPVGSAHDRSTSKLSLERPYELQQLVQDPEAATPRTSDSWLSRFSRRLSITHPRVYSIARRGAIYLRGPRPKVDMPPPIPSLNIDRHIHGCHVRVPIESNLIRLVRPFTNPWLLALIGVAYIISFAFFTRAQSFITAADSFIGCTATYWLANDGCGLNGQLCAPFDNSTFEFRCPAQCNNVILQNPRTVGNEEIAFKPLVVGGGDPNGTYRGDSFICAAAIQAGVISHSKGGCGALQLDGNFTNFVPFTNNGITSLGFPTVFPLSFSFLQGTTLDHCEDMRDGALAFNALICCLAFILLQSRPLALFWSLVCIGFWHVALFSQPQGPPPKLDVAFGTFLPVLFIAYGFWRLAVRFTFPAFSCAPLEASIWFLGPFWVGLLNNLTFDKLPLSRLTASDLNKRAGAITSLVVILCVVVVLVINQVRVIRKTGWLPHYLGWYILGGLVILVLALLPGLNLRLHHYILGMVIIPGTAFPTRLSLAYQGLCLGLFLNGAAAFGLDPILQTAADLRQDAALGSLLPSFLTNSTNYNSSIPFVDQTITWDMIPNSDWDGFALLVDDVQRYAGTALNFSLAAFDSNVPHFFRLAFTSGAQTGDFTKPATLWPNGTWIDPLPGPS